MIENQLLDFYKNKLTSWNLIYKPISLKYKIFKSIFAIISLIFIGLYLYAVFSTNNNKTILYNPFVHLTIYCLIVLTFFNFSKTVMIPAQNQAYKNIR